MDHNDVVVSAAALAVAVIIRRRKRRCLQHQRTVWTKKWLMERYSVRGISHFVSHEMDSTGVHGFLRMYAGTLAELLQLISPLISKTDTKLPDSITAEQQLIVTLRYLASGIVYHEINLLAGSASNFAFHFVCITIRHYRHSSMINFPSCNLQSPVAVGKQIVRGQLLLRISIQPLVCLQVQHF